MGKGFDIQMPPDITMDERIFLISHLKVPEEKLRGRVYTRDRTREKIRQTKSTIVDDYKLYAEARDAVRFRLDRLQTGDWSRLGYPQAWDSDLVFSSRLDVYQKEFVKVVGDTRASTAVAAFVQGAADLARLRDQVDTLSHDIVGFEVVAAAEAEEAAPIPLASVPEDQQRAILQARVAGHAPPEAPPNAVERASLDGRDLRRMDLVAQECNRLVSDVRQFRDKTTRPNELWQTDFTYLKVIGWGWFYLSTILDDYSRYIIAWKLCTTMKAADVTDTLELALDASGCNSATVVHKPRLLSDNGSSCVAADLADYLEDKGMDHVRGAPHHPQTQGKIERWHQTMKNRVLLENYYLPGDLERQIGAFVDHYNIHRYHESLNNLRPADVYHGRGLKILKMREEIKKQTIRKRRLQHQAAAS